MIPKAPQNKSLDNKALSNKFWGNIQKKIILTNKYPKDSLSTPITTRKNAINTNSKPAKSRIT
jgi:hypothetical protein